MTKSKSAANKKKATKVVRKVRKTKVTTTTPWTAEEDKIILNGFSMGRKFKDIAKDLTTTALAVKARHGKLVREGLKLQKKGIVKLGAVIQP